MNRSDFRRGDHIWFHNLGISDETSKKGTWNVSTLEDILHNWNHSFVSRLSCNIIENKCSNIRKAH